MSIQPTVNSYYSFKKPVPSSVVSREKAALSSIHSGKDLKATGNEVSKAPFQAVTDLFRKENEDPSVAVSAPLLTTLNLGVGGPVMGGLGMTSLSTGSSLESTGSVVRPKAYPSEGLSH